MSVIRRRASNARTSLHDLLISSISGESQKPLEDATWELLRKFKNGGPGSNVKVDYQVRMALLRCWTREELFRNASINEDVSLGTSTERAEESNGDTAQVPKKRKLVEAKKPMVGKMAKGEDFWSRISRHLADLFDTCGNQWDSSKAREVISQIVLKDHHLYGTSTSGCLPSIAITTSGTASVGESSNTSEEQETSSGASTAESIATGFNWDS